MARIVNETSYPDAEVRALVRLGMRGLNVKGVPVRVVPARRHVTGYAAWGRGRQRIVLRLPPPDVFPKTGWRRHRSSPLNGDHADWREALVALAAHEGRHIDLYRSGYNHYNSQRVEMACEAWQRGVVDDYRRQRDEAAA